MKEGIKFHGGKAFLITLLKFGFKFKKCKKQEICLNGGKWCFGAEGNLCACEGEKRMNWV
jgi:hypothetical protein